MMDTLDAAMGTCKAKEAEGKAKEPEASEAQCKEHNDAGCATLYQWWQANQCAVLIEKGAMYLPADKVPLHDECFNRLTEMNRCMASGSWLSPDKAQAKAQACAEKAKTDQAKEPQAVCTEGNTAEYSLDDGKFFCVPTQETADAWCADHYTAGYYAVNIDSRGGFGCMPTKQAANAWCNNHNPGSGWYTGKIKADGSFSCNMGKAARNAFCRNKYGRGWYAGSVRRDGTFLCHGQRQVQKRTTSHRRPRNVTRGPSGADIGAAIGTAIIQGIIASQHGGHGGSGE